MTEGRHRGGDGPERIDGARDDAATASHDDRPSVLASTGSMAIATLISRVTGFFKILLTAAVLGPAMASAFTTSNILPRTISELVLGAVLTAVVIPVLVRSEQEDADGGQAFVRKLFTTAMAVFGIGTVVSVACAPWLAELFIGDDSEVDLGLTTALAYLLLPTILFYGMTSLLTAILNTRSVFKPGAWAPVSNNVVAICTLVLFALMPGEITLDPVDMGQPKLLVLGIGTMLGAVAQIFVLAPAIRKQGISLKFLLGIDPRLKTFANMAMAIIVYVAISQAGMVITTRIAASADSAGPATYNFMWMLLQVPYGILGVTLLTAIMPQLSRNAANHDNAAVVRDLTMSTKMTLLMLLPVVMFFTFDGPAIGRALFHYGAFGEDSATMLGVTLAASGFTLIPYALVLLQLRVFYAREEAWTPTFIIIGIMGVKTVLSLLAPTVFDPEHVVVALGAANGLGFVVGMFVGGYLLRRSLGRLNLASVLSDAVRILLAAAAGVAAMVLVELLTDLHGAAQGGRGLLSLAAVIVDGLVMVTVTVIVLSRMHVAVFDRVGGAVVGALARRLPARFTPARMRRTSPDDDDAAGSAGHPDAPRDTSSAARRPEEAARDGAPQPEPRPAPLLSGPGQPLPGLMVPYPGFDTASYDPILPRVDAALRKLNVTDSETTAHRAARPAGGPRLIPGAMVAGGRYRLLARHGGPDGLQFWKALDTRLDRDVALTFIDPAQTRSGGTGIDADGIETHTLRLGRISEPGLARVLDVVRGSSGGIVVAEWTEGSPLHTLAETHPPAAGAAHATAVLAAAAEAAHRAGTALGIDHPDRIRIAPDGSAVLAFPATLPAAGQAGDVHGLGAVLYALLTGEWPDGDTHDHGRVGGLATALPGPQGLPTEPHVVRPEVPFEISAVAMRAIQGDSGIRTAATIAHVLAQAAAGPQQPSAGDRQGPGGPPGGAARAASAPTDRTGDGPSSYSGPATGSAAGRSDDPHAATGGPARRTRSYTSSVAFDSSRPHPSRRAMGAILAGLAVAVVVVIGLVLAWGFGALGGGSDVPAAKEKAALGLTSSAQPTPEAPQSPAPPPPPETVPAAPASIAVYSPQGVPDDPRGAALAIDGNPGTQWSTDQYFQQLPALKNGVGLMAAFDHPVKVVGVGIDSPSPGTHVEIRTAPGPDASVGQTTVIGSGDLVSGHNTIELNPDAEPTGHVLVWLTRLGDAGSRYQSKITELTFTVQQ